MVVLPTSTMRLSKSFFLERATTWKRSYLKSFEQRQSVSEREQLGERRPFTHPFKFPTSSMSEEYTAWVRPVLARLGYRSILAVPLLREERIVGGLVVWRQETGRFLPEVVNLLQTFATQSALRFKMHGCSEKSRRRTGRSSRPTATSRSFSPTCRTS